ncbi:MAG: hypothetical protein H0U28_11895 [Nocardioidaceae bacterium]|nr:hypothetical protein [Nocardioidaceae bacterium]
MKDRLDRLDRVPWRPSSIGVPMLVVVDAAREARQQAMLMKQLLAALRLPDERTGRRPQRRGGARGAYAPAGTPRRTPPKGSRRPS